MVGNIFHAGVFSPEIAGLFVFVHPVISKTYYTCPIIVLELCFFTSLWACCSEDRIFVFPLSIFSGHYYFFHSGPSSTFLSRYIFVCFRRTFRFVYSSVLSPSTDHYITPGS